MQHRLFGSRTRYYTQNPIQTEQHFWQTAVTVPESSSTTITVSIKLIGTLTKLLIACQLLHDQLRLQFILAASEDPDLFFSLDPDQYVVLQPSSAVFCNEHIVHLLQQAVP